MQNDKYTVLEVGEIYRHRSGALYKCVALKSGYDCVLERSDQWTCEANGVRMTKGGEIHWDFSTGGHWASEREI